MVFHMMMVGDPSVFALESSMTQSYPQLSLRGLGFFVIHIAGKSYGVRAADATALACSLDAVQERIARRGTHGVRFDVRMPAIDIIRAFRVAWYYNQPGQDQRFFGLTCDGIVNTLRSGGIVWAPDGDEAFDDGSYVLQFDLGDKVRLIAFRDGDCDPEGEVVRTLSDIWLDADAFYGVLDQWQSGFESAWALAVC